MLLPYEQLLHTIHILTQQLFSILSNEESMDIQLSWLFLYTWLTYWNDEIHTVLIMKFYLEQCKLKLEVHMFVSYTYHCTPFPSIYKDGNLLLTPLLNCVRINLGLVWTSKLPKNLVQGQTGLPNKLAYQNNQPDLSKVLL